MGTGAAFSTTQAYLSGYHPVPMYAVPTVVFEDSTAANYSAFNYVSGAHVPLTALVNPTGNVQTNEMWFLQATIGTTWASGAPVVFEKGVDITKSIRFEARL
jgi:hypothetical protein